MTGRAETGRARSTRRTSWPSASEIRAGGMGARPTAFCTVAATRLARDGLRGAAALTRGGPLRVVYAHTSMRSWRAIESGIPRARPRSELTRCRRSGMRELVFGQDNAVRSRSVRSRPLASRRRDRQSRSGDLLRTALMICSRDGRRRRISPFRASIPRSAQWRDPLDAHGPGPRHPQPSCRDLPTSFLPSTAAAGAGPHAVTSPGADPARTALPARRIGARRRVGLLGQNFLSTATTCPSPPQRRSTRPAAPTASTPLSSPCEAASPLDSPPLPHRRSPPGASGVDHLRRPVRRPRALHQPGSAHRPAAPLARGHHHGRPFPLVKRAQRVGALGERARWAHRGGGGYPFDPAAPEPAAPRARRSAAHRSSRRGTRSGQAREPLSRTARAPRARARASPPRPARPEARSPPARDSGRGSPGAGPSAPDRRGAAPSRSCGPTPRRPPPHPRTGPRGHPPRQGRLPPRSPRCRRR